MNRKAIVVILLALLAVLAGHLLSSISLVGRTGINIFYTEYKFLKVWWKAASLVFLLWILVFVIQHFFKRRMTRLNGILVQLVALLIAAIGLFYSYSDFRHTLSHRWLGERFHLGVYLFWIVWIGLSFYVLTVPRKIPASVPASEPMTNNGV